MKQRYLLLSILLMGSFLSMSAQQNVSNPGSRAKAAIQFTKILEEAAIAYPPHLSYLTELGAKIESGFRISEDGTLSVTFRYPVDNSFALYRLTAPVSALKSVFYDYYIGLEFEGAVVNITESDKGSRELKESNKMNLFHIAMPGDGPNGERLKARFEQGLQAFRENYK